MRFVVLLDLKVLLVGGLDQRARHAELRPCLTLEAVEMRLYALGRAERCYGDDWRCLQETNGPCC